MRASCPNLPRGRRAAHSFAREQSFICNKIAGVIRDNSEFVFLPFRPDDRDSENREFLCAINQFRRSKYEDKGSDDVSTT